MGRAEAQIGIRDGIRVKRCTRCPTVGRDGWWSMEAGFHKNASNKSTGLSAWCKVCFQEIHQAKKAADPEGVKARRQAYYRKQRTKQLEADKKIASAPKRVFYPMDEWRPHLLEWIKTLEQIHGDREGAAAAARVTSRRLREIVNAPRELVERETVEKLALAVGVDLSEDEEPGVDGWSPKHKTRFCSVCGTWEHPHQAKGMCSRCYTMKRQRGKDREEWMGLWAKKAGHKCCKECGTTKRKHVAKGLCKNCYHRLAEKAKRANKKARAREGESVARAS